MGRKRKGGQGKVPKFDFRKWGDKSLPIIRAVVVQIELDDDEPEGPGPGKKVQPSTFQPLMKHMVKEERKERDLVSTMASNKPIPIPGVTPLPEEEYSSLYPVAYTQCPPFLIEAPVTEVDVETLSEEDYLVLYPPVFNEIPTAWIRGESGPDEPEIEVTPLERKKYDKLYPPVFKEMPPLLVVPDEDQIARRLVREKIQPDKRNPYVLVKRLVMSEGADSKSRGT